MATCLQRYNPTHRYLDLGQQLDLRQLNLGQRDLGQLVGQLEGQLWQLWQLRQLGQQGVGRPEGVPQPLPAAVAHGRGGQGHEQQRSCVVAGARHVNDAADNWFARAAGAACCEGRDNCSESTFRLRAESLIGLGRPRCAIGLAESDLGITRFNSTPRCV
jgi:hypothetical protein